MTTPDYELPDKLRGYSFLPEAHELEAIPKPYGTEGTPLKDKLIHLRYYCGESYWLVAEYSPEEGIFFGFACLNGDSMNSEWGYASVAELRSLFTPKPVKLIEVTDGQELELSGVVPIVVERDLHWTPQPFGMFEEGK